MKAVIPILKERMTFLQRGLAKQILFYGIAIIILFLALIMTDKFFVEFPVRYHLMLFMATSVLLGFISIKILGNNLFDNFSEWKKILITIAGNLLGFLIFFKFSNLVESDNFLILFAPSMLLFSLPIFLQNGFNSVLQIPSLEYVPIQIENLEIAERGWSDETKGIIWEIENSGLSPQGETYQVRTHTPLEIQNLTLKTLYKSFLSLHNLTLQPNTPIRLKSNDERFATWRFYAISNSIFGESRLPLNPDKTLSENGVRFNPLSKKKREQISKQNKNLHPNFKTIKIVVSRVE